MSAELCLGDLVLSDRRGRRMPERTDRGVRIEGEGSWILRGPESSLDPIDTALTGVCERLGPEVLLIEFGNSVGHFSVPELGTLEVVSGKWEESHFETMLRDITNVAASLPFSAETSGSLPYDRSIAGSRRLLYHAFVYLRHVLWDGAPRDARLFPALRQVLREPHRRLSRRVGQVSIDRVRRLDATDAIRILQRPGRLVPLHTALNSPLAEAFGGRLPERIGETRPTIDFDTPENRFVKTFLGSIEAVLSGMAELSRHEETNTRQTVFWRRIGAEAAELKRRPRPLTMHAL